jgi:FkbM family methyltransferase
VALKRLLPLAVRQRARSIVDDQRLTSDWDSFRTLRRVARGHGTAVPVRLKALNGASVHLRPGTTDRQVALDTFARPYHRPPLDIQPRLIFDLGANVGLTMADMAVLFPDAQIIGVELDPVNADMARQNVAAFGARCEVITAAVWSDDGTVPYVSRPGAEWTSVIDRDQLGEPSSEQVRAVSLNSLLDGRPRVDYVKMDIEGAEKEVLQGDCAWAERVDCINVEAHTGHYALSDCTADLRRMGFATELRHGGAVAHVLGRRSKAKSRL